MNKNRIRLTESLLHRVIKESVKKILREGIIINDDEINEMGIMKWFDNNAPIGYSLKVVDGGGNRAYHLYDEKEELLGSWDDVDGFLSNSGFFN